MSTELCNQCEDKPASAGYKRCYLCRRRNRERQRIYNQGRVSVPNAKVMDLIEGDTSAHKTAFVARRLGDPVKNWQKQFQRIREGRNPYSGTYARLRFALDDSWMDEGACADHPVPDLWWPTDEANSADVRAICDACPVREVCLVSALSAPEGGGIWGGTTTAERKRLRRL